MMSWSEFQPVLVEKLTRLIDSKPESLLEQDGGPWGLKADIILAVLYGMEGQVDAVWRVPRTESTLLRPVVPGLRSILADTEFALMDLATPNTMEYRLQSSWATMTLDWTVMREMLPDDVHPERGTAQVKVALLRYRHRI